MNMKCIAAFACLILMLAACSTEAPKEASSDRKPKTVVQSEGSRVQMDKNEMVNEADVIVLGSAVSQSVQKDFTGFPVTDTVIQVETVYKGTAADTLEVRAAGGETEDMIDVVSENAAVSFTIGESVVLFLSQNGGSRPNEDAFYYVVGQAQGIFDAEASPEGIIEDSTGTHTFDFDTLQHEINELEIYNDKHQVPRLMLPEGQESDI